MLIQVTPHSLIRTKQFLNCHDYNNKQQSKIFYMEMVNENPDSDETMVLVVEDLLDKFNVKYKVDGWYLWVMERCISIY